MVVKELHEPYYAYIARWLREQILDDEYPVDARLPSEGEIARRFGVSRVTARLAVTQLVNEGMVYRAQGKGAFVARNKIERNLNSLVGFFEEMRNRGLYPESKILEFVRRLPDEREQRQLQLRKDDEVYSVRRIRYLSEVPLGVQHFVVPVRLVPGFEQLDLKTTSFYLFLRELGLPLKTARQKIEATLTPEIAELLEIAPGTPFLRIERVSFVQDDVPVELLISWFRGDRYSYDITLSP